MVVKCGNTFSETQVQFRHSSQQTGNYIDSRLKREVCISTALFVCAKKMTQPFETNRNYTLLL